MDANAFLRETAGFTTTEHIEFLKKNIAGIQPGDLPEIKREMIKRASFNRIDIGLIEEAFKDVLNFRKEEKKDAAAITYWFDSSNGVSFEKNNLYKLGVGKKGDYARFMFHVPMILKDVINFDGETKICYRMETDPTDRTDTIKDMVSHIAIDLRTTHDDNKFLTMFLNSYAQDAIAEGRVKFLHAPIYLEGDLVRVGYDTTGIDNKANLARLRQFYEFASNQHAFLSVNAFGLFAPFSYWIRNRCPAGYTFPIHVSYGTTMGAKTSTDSIVVEVGFDQAKNDAILPGERIATKFTFEKNLGRSILPVVLNDVNQEFFDNMDSLLKNSAENGIAGERGQADQTTVIRENKRAIYATTNVYLNLSDDIALNRRYALEHYDEGNVKRMDLNGYHSFMETIQRGYMYGIIKELFDGHSIQEVVNLASRTRDSTELIQAGIGLINQLCDRHSILRFPDYTAGNLKGTETEVTEVCEYMISQFKRYQDTDDMGRLKPPYPELTQDEILVEWIDKAMIIWFTGSAYKKCYRRLNLKHKTAADLFQNIPESDIAGKHSDVKSKKINGNPVKAYALYYRADGI